MIVARSVGNRVAMSPPRLALPGRVSWFDANALRAESLSQRGTASRTLRWHAPSKRCRPVFRGVASWQSRRCASFVSDSRLSR